MAGTWSRRGCGNFFGVCLETLKQILTKFLNILNWLCMKHLNGPLKALSHYSLKIWNFHSPGLWMKLWSLKCVGLEKNLPHSKLKFKKKNFSYYFKIKMGKLRFWQYSENWMLKMTDVIRPWRALCQGDFEMYSNQFEYFSRDNVWFFGIKLVVGFH